MNSKKRKVIVLIVSLLALFLGGGIIFAFIPKEKQETANHPTKSSSSSPNKNKEPKDQSNDNPKSDNPKKILANQIKADLQKDLVEVKKEEKSKNNGFERCSWLKSLGENCTDCRGNEWRLTYFGSDKDKWKDRMGTWEKGWIEVFPEELEPDDWKEIEGLIQQVKELEKKKKKELQEEQAKIDQKLNSNPKLFLYEDVWDWWDNDPRDYDKRHVFRGMENNQKFYLVFPKNHPAISSLPNSKEFPNQKQKETLVLIEGIENKPLLKSVGKADSWKKVNLSDKITITKPNS